MAARIKPIAAKSPGISERTVQGRAELETVSSTVLTPKTAESGASFGHGGMGGCVAICRENSPASKPEELANKEHGSLSFRCLPPQVQSRSKKGAPTTRDNTISPFYR